MDRRVSFGLCAAALVFFHLALTEHFLGFGTVFSATPIGGDDFDTHIAQTYRVIEGLEKFGKSWVYDVKLLAGQPEGTIFDADNKGWELWTYALYRLGMPKGMAFNTYILAAHLAAPLVLFWAARLFGVGRFASLLAGLFGSLYWFFDSFAHWAWWVGMVAYASAAYFVVLPLGCFYRFTQTRRAGYAIGTALLLALAHLNHPYSFFVLAPGCGALYLMSARSFGGREHGLVAGIVVFTIAANAFWLHAALIHWHYVLDSAYFGQTGFSYLLADFFGVLLNPSDSGVIGTRASVRFMCFALALFALVIWRRERDPRLGVFATVLAVLFALSYMGAYIPHAGQIQPYRHVLPLGFVSAVAGAAFVEHAFTSGALSAAALPARLSLAALGLLAFQLLVRDALYFMPELLPPVQPMIDGSRTPITEHGYGRIHDEVGHVSYRFPRGPWMQYGAHSLVQWIEKNTAMGDRVLIDGPPYGERVAWRNDVEVLGGFRERNVAHAYANFFRAFPEPVSDETVTDYLAAYAVRWVIVHGPRRPDLERSPWLELQHEESGRRIYRNRVAVSQIRKGGGRLRARTNRIEVWGSDPNQELVLAYHFHEMLRCHPDCRIERLPSPISRIGFIRVPAPHPRDLVIWNGYQ
jgi:hypothetical protein